MKFQLKYMLAATGLLLANFVGEAWSQVNLPLGPSNYEHDFQLFAPLELDLDNQPPSDYSGYFINYDKLFWSYTGERVTVGSPNVVAFAEEIYRQNPADEGIRPDPPQIFNTINDVPPKAGFAFGNRYELGYRDRDSGWLVGVLDGPELHQSEFYGFAPRALDGGLPPFIDPDFTDGSDIGPGGGGVFDLRAFGFGSVPILFETPPGFLLGFRDYLNFLAGALIGTQGGPMLYIGNYGLIPEIGIDDDTITVFRVADDIDGDGIPGAFVTIDPITGLLVPFTDFEDLHQFNVYFDNVFIRNTTETNGVEVMASHTLTNRHYQAKRQNNHVEIYYGARYLSLYDNFRVDAQGSILGASFWDTSINNQIVGPQVGIRWVNQRQRWQLRADGKFMFGYNTQDFDQIGLVGEELIPGALNRPLYARPTAFTHGRQERDFSPVAELRLQAKYSFTRSFGLNVGYTGMFIGNIRRAASSVHYKLPDMGFLDSGTQDMLVNGFDLGVEFVH